MDTRTKVITAEAAWGLASAQKPVALVTGYFDVLQAADAGDLARARESYPDAILLVAILPPPQPLFEPGARAGMVAALAVVDYVVSFDSEQIATLLAAIPAQRVMRLEASHVLRMRELTEHVKHRQNQ